MGPVSGLGGLGGVCRWRTLSHLDEFFVRFQTGVTIGVYRSDEPQRLFGMPVRPDRADPTLCSPWKSSIA